MNEIMLHWSIHSRFIYLRKLQAKEQTFRTLKHKWIYEWNYRWLYPLCYFVKMCIVLTVMLHQLFGYFVFKTHKLIKINWKKLKFINSNTSVEVEWTWDRWVKNKWKNETIMKNNETVCLSIDVQCILWWIF